MDLHRDGKILRFSDLRAFGFVSPVKARARLGLLLPCRTVHGGIKVGLSRLVIGSGPKVWTIFGGPSVLRW